MESISKKIVDLEKKNIILKTDGLKLSYEAPKDKINKEILDFLKENKSLRKESKVVQTKKQYGDFSLTALSFASISIFSG